MIVGYSFQPLPSQDSLMNCFTEPAKFVKDNIDVMNTLKNIVENHTVQINDSVKSLRQNGCEKVLIGTGVTKEAAWERFIKKVPSKSYIIVPDFSAISESFWFTNESVLELYAKDIYVLDFDNAMMAEITFDKVNPYYKKIILDAMAKRVIVNRGKTTSDKVVAMTLEKKTVNQIIEATGLSRSTVFRVRRESGLKERFYHRTFVG